MSYHYWPYALDGKALMPRRKREFEDLIARLTPVVWSAVREEYAQNCCIAATRILKGVFEYYGYTSQAVPCNVYVFNPKCLELMRKGLIPDDPQERAALYEKTGAWALGITRDSARLGREIPGGSFGGHLVLKVRQILIDATLKQAERPEKQIMLPDLTVIRNVPGGFWTDKKFTMSLDNGCAVTYEHNHNYIYRSAPDWMRGAEFAPYLETVNKIIARVEAQDSTEAGIGGTDISAVFRFASAVCLKCGAKEYDVPRGKTCAKCGGQLVSNPRGG